MWPYQILATVVRDPLELWWITKLQMLFPPTPLCNRQIWRRSVLWPSYRRRTFWTPKRLITRWLHRSKIAMAVSLPQFTRYATNVLCRRLFALRKKLTYLFFNTRLTSIQLVLAVVKLSSMTSKLWLKSHPRNLRCVREGPKEALKRLRPLALDHGLRPLSINWVLPRSTVSAKLRK